MRLNTSVDTIVRINRIISKLAQGAIAPLFLGLSLLVPEAASAQTSNAQFVCTGQMGNGWSYSAEYSNGQFTQIRWTQPGQTPQTSTLSFYTYNAQGEPVYRGAFRAAAAVTLVDLSQGSVHPGSQISVGVEEWGWSRGTCSSTAPDPVANTMVDIDSVRRSLLGLEQEAARVWLRQNNFSFTQTMEHTDTRVIERWNRTSTQAVDVIIVNGTISDVVLAPLNLGVIQQNLLGVEDAFARNWLRQNGFFFNVTLENTSTRVTERWNQNPTQAVDVIFIQGMVASVVEAPR